jgi:hypothetical protein
MANMYLLSEYSDCYALLTPKDIHSGDFMADTNGIYEAPEIDGFIGFLKVVACTKPKGSLPLINQSHIVIPNSIKHEKFWVAKLETEDSGSLKIRNGFVNLIGIQIPQQ